MKEQNIAQNKMQLKEQAFLLYDTRSNSIVIFSSFAYRYILNHVICNTNIYLLHNIYLYSSIMLTPLFDTDIISI